MTEGLSHRAAGRVAGVSKTAIGKAIESGHLKALPDGKVTAEALDEWMQGRRAPRGGNLKRFSRPIVKVATAMAAEAWASDVARALLPHLSDASIRAIHYSLLDQWRREAAALADDDFAATADLASGLGRRLFTRTLPPACDAEATI